jgi:hypothetical protein
MNLYVFPSYPGQDNGYRKAVGNDLHYFNPLAQDTVIYFDTVEDPSKGGRFLSRSRRRFRRIASNLLKMSPFSEVSADDLKQLFTIPDFEAIICGEVVFYRALRKLFPGRRMIVRLHNFYSLIPIKLKFRPVPIGLKYLYTIDSMSRLEREILSDPLCSCMFITEEEMNAGKLLQPKLECSVLPIAGLGSWPQGAENPETRKLIIFGSLMAPHTKTGVNYFIKRIFLGFHLCDRYELHLFGSGTETYDDPRRDIYGHGFYKGSTLPFEGKGLFLVPDIYGLGIKMKINDLLSQGACVLATPEAMFGYPHQGLPNLHIADLGAWSDIINDLYSH